VRWKSHEGKRVESLAGRPQKWFTSPYFSYVLVAKEWGLRPSALGLCRPDEDFAVMLAFVDTQARMTEKVSIEQEKAMKRSQGKS
jgi:hypothetical protein